MNRYLANSALRALALTLLGCWAHMASPAWAVVDETSGAEPVQAYTEGEGEGEGEGDGAAYAQEGEVVTSPPIADPLIDAIRNPDAPLLEEGPLPETPNSNLTADFLRMLATLLVLCGIIIVAGYLVRRLGSKSPLLAGPSLGQVLGRVHLSPKASLQFVRVADRVLIVGLTPTAMTLITEMDAEHFEPAPVPARRSFMEELQATSATLDAPRASDDQELTALRGDIKRLQQYLQEAVRDQP